MTNNAVYYVDTFGKKGILIDTNLFLLLVIGSINSRYIQSSGLLQKFDKNDYDLLVGFTSHFRTKLVTPNILTETSNLLEGFNSRTKLEPYKVLNSIVNDNLVEVTIPSKDATSTKGFLKFGLTDITIEKVHEQLGCLILTDDMELSHYLSKKTNGAVINFEHIRSPLLLLQ